MLEIILKIRHFERGLPKSVKKSQLFFFFQTQFLLVDKVIKNKRGLETSSKKISGNKTSSEKFYY